MCLAFLLVVCLLVNTAIKEGSAVEGGGLRLLVWNCNGGFRKKQSVLQLLKPDIAIIAEASNDFVEGLAPAASSSLWIGDNTARGLGVAAFNGWRLERADFIASERLFLPCVAVRGNNRVQVVAVCVKKAIDYVSPTLAVLHCLADFIGSAPTILAGDFNASVAFARPKPFQLVLDRLDGLHMRSAWHQFRGENFGEETAPTYFMHWSNDPQKGSHIDYAFVSRDLGVEEVGIGSYADYPGRRLSDHAPILVDLHLPLC